MIGNDLRSLRLMYNTILWFVLCKAVILNLLCLRSRFHVFFKMFVPYNIERITAPYSAVVYFNQPQGASHAVHWSKPVYSVFASFSVKHRKKKFDKKVFFRTN